MRLWRAASVLSLAVLSAGIATAQVPAGQEKVGAKVEVNYFGKWLPAEITEVTTWEGKKIFRVRYLADGTTDSTSSELMRPLGAGSTATVVSPTQSSSKGRTPSAIAKPLRAKQCGILHDNDRTSCMRGWSATGEPDRMACASAVARRYQTCMSTGVWR
jgi:hypothetical protein